MRKLLLISLLLSAGIASAGTITASGNASLSSATNWTGGVAPNCTTDNIVTAGFTVTDDVANCHIGDAVGIGVSVSASGGKFVVNTGLTVTFKGTGITTAVPWKTVANATMDLSAANVTVNYDCAAYCAGLNLGIYKDAASTVVDIPAANITWNNASGTNNIVGIVANVWDFANGIYIIKMRSSTATLPDPGPVSNLAGTGLGSFGNTSIAKTSGGFDGNTFNEVSSYAGISANGDFFVDYQKGIIYYKSSSSTLTVNFSFTFGDWAGWGILSNGNTANNSLTINGTYSHCGSHTSTNENDGQCFFASDHYAPNFTDTTRTLTIGSPTFNFCTRAIGLYAFHITPTDPTHHTIISGATFNNCRYVTTNVNNQADGLIQLGYNESYLDVTNLVANTFTNLFTTFVRQSGTQTQNIVVTGVTFPGQPSCVSSCGSSTVITSSGQGNLLEFNMLPTGTCNDTLQTSVFSGFQQPVTGGGNPDGSTFTTPGVVTCGSNTYTNNTISHGYRSARIDNYMIVTNNTFPQSSHHGLVMRAGDGFIDGTTITVTNNVIYCQGDTESFSGGMTLPWAAQGWVDRLTISNNTFHQCLRGIDYNDEESTIGLITRTSVYNNIVDNNSYGLYRPAASASTNLSSIGLTLEDYNDDYQNNTQPTNYKQGTFMFGGVNYNSSGSKTALGAYLENPSYTLPFSTPQSLVMVVSGATPATKSITLAWGGGTPVQYIQAAGGTSTNTLTGTATTANCPSGAGATCTTMADSLAAFPIAGTGLKGMQVRFIGGTCSGQTGLIYTNTATGFGAFSNTATSAFAACTPDNTSQYILINIDQQLFDSGAVQSINAQLTGLELTTTNGTYTDANITIAKNYPGTSGANNGVNPTYTSTSDFHPHNAALKGTGLGGLDIGALPALGNGCGFTILLGGVGCN